MGKLHTQKDCRPFFRMQNPSFCLKVRVCVFKPSPQVMSRNKLLFGRRRARASGDTGARRTRLSRWFSTCTSVPSRSYTWCHKSNTIWEGCSGKKEAMPGVAAVFQIHSKPRNCKTGTKTQARNMEEPFNSRVRVRSHMAAQMGSSPWYHEFSFGCDGGLYRPAVPHHYGLFRQLENSYIM